MSVIWGSGPDGFVSLKHFTFDSYFKSLSPLRPFCSIWSEKTRRVFTSALLVVLLSPTVCCSSSTSAALALQKEREAKRCLCTGPGTWLHVSPGGSETSFVFRSSDTLWPWISNEHCLVTFAWQIKHFYGSSRGFYAFITLCIDRVALPVHHVVNDSWLDFFFFLFFSPSSSDSEMQFSWNETLTTQEKRKTSKYFWIILINYNLGGKTHTLLSRSTVYGLS